MTDYKNKYLKYKNKYLELRKNLIGGSNNVSNIDDKVSIESYRNKLNKIYPSVVFDNANKGQISTSNNNTTYGEMNYEGIEILNTKLNPLKTIDTFIDIGSGRGKLVLWYAGESNVTKSIGIEIVESRYKDAEALKQKLETPQITNKVEFINKDFLDINFRSLIENNSKVLVWLSNLCFSKDVTDKIFDKVVKEFPTGTIICCSSETSNQNVRLVDKISVPMSWSSSSMVYVYTF